MQETIKCSIKCHAITCDNGFLYRYKITFPIAHTTRNFQFSPLALNLYYSIYYIHPRLNLCFRKIFLQFNSLGKLIT